MLLPPVKKPITPVRLGTDAYISPRALPAFTAAIIASESDPVTTNENSFNDSPNGTSCSPRAARLLPPVKKPITPVMLGIESYISPSALPAETAAVTDSPFTPTTTEEKSFIALPNGTSCSASVDIFCPPVNQLITPLVFGRFA